MMRRFLVTFLITFLITFLLSIVGIEAALAAVDPWGVRYFDDVQSIWQASAPDVTGYSFKPGRYIFGPTAFTIEADGLRAVPGRDSNGPRVAFVGDSVTFGQGVNDADTWVSLMAAALRLNAMNHGRSAYSIANVARVLDGIDGCAVFLTIANDPAPAQHYRASRPYPALWLSRYLMLILTPPAIPAYSDRYAPLYEAVAARPDTLILAFDDGEYGNIMRDEYGAVLIPPFTSRISVSDAHADAEGNRQIADAARPIIQNWLDEHDCT